MNLNSEQLAAATSPEKRIAVSAAAGTGKSTTMAARVTYLLDEWRVLPSSIVAITFTRLAAQSLQAKVKQQGPTITTLHGFCLRLIREHGQSIGYEPSWLTIIGEEDATFEQDIVLKDSGCKGGRKRWDAFLEGVTAGSIERGKDEDAITSDLWALWDIYIARLRAMNTLTYGTMLIEALRLLDDRKALAFFRDRYRHFLVDEAQDTNALQWSILWRFVDKADPDSLFLVGDIDQSLYSWRGAAPEQFLRYLRGDKGCVMLPLRQTFRFGAGIARPANAVISHNRDRLPLEVVPNPSIESTYKAETRLVLNDDADMRAISDGLKRFAANYDEVAVISRRHDPLRKLSETLTEVGIPHVRIGRDADLRESRPFKVIMAYLRLSVNPTVNTLFRWVASAEAVPTDVLMAYRQKWIRDRIPLYTQHLAEQYGSEPPSTPLEVFQHLQRCDATTDYREAANYIILKAHANGLDTAEAVIEWFTIADLQDEIPKGPGSGVTLCTVHASKGLEWDHVTVIDAVEGKWPKAGQADIEEDRRLFYVAITRARKSVEVWPVNGSGRPANPCVFVEEAEA